MRLAGQAFAVFLGGAWPGDGGSRGAGGLSGAVSAGLGAESGRPQALGGGTPARDQAGVFSMVREVKKHGDLKSNEF